MSSTMGGQQVASQQHHHTPQQMAGSIGNSGAIAEQSEGGSATNQDLTKRLAEMKAKLQALKKK